MPDIREQIYSIIIERAYKQSEIARRSGLTPDQLCAVLKKRRRLDANELFRVCEALGMTPEAVAAYTPSRN